VITIAMILPKIN